MIYDIEHSWKNLGSSSSCEHDETVIAHLKRFLEDEAQHSFKVERSNLCNKPEEEVENEPKE